MLILSGLIPALVAGAQTTSNLDSQYEQLQQQQKDIEKQQTEVKKKLQSNSADQAAIKQQIGLINNNMSAIKSQIDLLNTQIDDCNQKIADKNAEIDKTQKEIEKNTEIYKERVCSMYEIGNVSRIEVLLSSKSMQDFLTRYDLIRMIQQHDKDLISKLNTDKTKLDTEKKDLDTQKAQLVAKQSTLDSQKKKYEAQDSESTKLYSQLKGESSKLQDQIDRLDKLEQEANDKLKEIIKKKQEEAEKKNPSSGYVGGTWLWPIQNMPGQYISSPFGPRAGHSVPHSGIDIAAAGINGHPILASNSGTVIEAGYDRIYGYHVIIDHGGGMSTLYGHCSKLAVSEGATVKRGQVIGYVGNTGNVVSLGGGGYHLHFQIMKYGTPLNPLNYVHR